MPTFVNGEGGLSVRTKVNASITTTDALDQGLATTDTPSFVSLILSGTGAIQMPDGTTAERPASPVIGMFRFNTETNSFEGYDGTAWGDIGGGGGGGGGLFKGENGEVGSSPGDIFRINEQTLNTNVTIDADENASATGPLAVASGVTLTVTSGGSLVIV